MAEVEGLRLTCAQNCGIRWPRSDTAAFAVVCALVFAATIVYTVHIKGRDRGAFNRWRPALAGFAQGEDLYVRHAFPTPPIMAMILYPFSRLPNPVGAIAWATFKSLAAIMAMLGLLNCCRLSFARDTTKTALLAFAFAAGPMTGDIVHGNVNLWVFALVIGGVYFLMHNAPWTAGGFLSLAVACKLTPILLLGYFAWKRSWNVVAASLVGLVVWLILIPGFILGFERNQNLLESWTNLMVRPFALNGVVDTEQVNQSLPALLHRVLTPAIAIKGEGDGVDESIGILHLDSRQIRLVVAGLVVGVLIPVAWLMRTNWTDTNTHIRMHEIALVLLLMLLFSERSWKHHYVSIFLPALILVTETRLAAERGSLDWRFGVALAALTMAGLGMLFSSTDAVRWTGDVRLAKLVQAWGGYVWAALALAAAHAIFLIDARSHSQSVPASSQLTTKPVLEFAR